MAYSAGQELSSLAFDKIIGGALDAVVKAQNNSSMTTVEFIKNTGFLLDDAGRVKEPIYVAFHYPKELAPYQPAQPASFSAKIEAAGSGYATDNISGFTINDKPITPDYSLDTTGKFVSFTLPSDLAGVKEGDVVTIAVNDETMITAPARIVVKGVAAKPAQPAVYQDMQLKVPILTMLPVPFIRIESTDIEFNVKINSVNTTESSSDSRSSFNTKANAGYKGFGFHADVSLSASISSQKKTKSTEDIKKEFSLNIKIHAVQDEMPAGVSRILDILEEAIVPVNA